jgi:Putative DNA-binding domain
MSARAELLFRELQSKNSIEGLLGKPEDADFDCKEWHGKSATSTGSIAKAACGFANATGGVIVIGMKATGRGDKPDLVNAPAPVDDIEAVSSTVLDIILKQVEPGIEGVQIQTVPLERRGKSGFVLVYVPEADGSPRRSRVNKEFYVRIASGTVPMEYFQIEDRFGRRPHARLEVSATEGTLRENRRGGQLMQRTLVLSVKNEGRGLARFPALRCQRSGGLQQSSSSAAAEQSLWTFSDANPEWLSFRGGANHVVYPGESLRIATVIQPGQTTSRPSGYGIPIAVAYEWAFSALTIVTEVVCDGSPTHRQSFAFGGATYPPR